MDNRLSQHFRASEFRCRCLNPACAGKLGLDLVAGPLLALLEAMRAEVRRPIIITSGRRCTAHNQAVGGHPQSAHLRGLAADLRVMSSAERYALVKAALAAGVGRIGVGEHLIHVDMDVALPQEVYWLY